MAIVEVDAVTKTFGQPPVQVHALRDLSLDVEEGEFTALSGASGSGKTTLLYLIGALDRPTSGDVRLEGQSLGALDHAQRSVVRRDRIGFVFQAYNLIGVQTALENATAVLALQGVDAAERRRRGLEIFETMGIADLADRLPDALSGGQQQRVAVARALVSRPAIVLADEPTANLDSVTAERLLETMHALQASHGATFLFSTHDPRVIRHARRHVVLVDGQVASDERR